VTDVTTTPLGLSQWLREYVTVYGTTRTVVREQWAGDPNGEAAVLIGRTHTTHM
jgi:hypothetical protein